MSEPKTARRWISYVMVGCSKSMLDLRHYVDYGTFDTFIYGLQPFRVHPIAASLNILLDAAALIGTLLAVLTAMRKRYLSPAPADPF